jgi:hypothetical protein
MLTHTQINLIHIFIIVPFFFFLYYYFVHRDDKKIPSSVCYSLLLISSIGIIYHLYKLLQNKDNKLWNQMVNLMHIFIIFPLLFYIGYKCNDTERSFMELLLLLTFAALGYHLYNYLVY